MTEAAGQPSLVIIAGPNGSGKSTLTRLLVQRGVDLGEYINPDDIAAELTGSYADRVRRAQTIADERRAGAIQARRSFSFETVMSHPSKLGVLAEAKEAGFLVQMFFVATEDPLINVARVADRVSKGGHDVPTDRIVARYERTLRLLPDALLLCNAATLFDNSSAAIVPWLQLRRAGDRLIVRVGRRGAMRAPPSWIAEACLRLIAISDLVDHDLFQSP